MENEMYEKIIIVEGASDKKKLVKIINDERVRIICTNGTLGVKKFDELLETFHLDDNDVFILVDEDETGIKLRKFLQRELPHAEHIHIKKEYREVATTPAKELAIALASKNIEINIAYI